MTISPSSDRNAPRSEELVAIPDIERATHAIGLFISDDSGLDVSQAEAHVLTFLLARTNARINEIHEEFGHRRSTLTSVLDRLERRKALTRSVDTEDRRSVTVTLTRSGKALATNVSGVLRAFETRALDGISATELAAFHRVVDRFRMKRRSDG